MNKEDFEAVEEALEIMGITDVANRCVDELSGGQRQRSLDCYGTCSTNRYTSFR